MYDTNSELEQMQAQQQHFFLNELFFKSEDDFLKKISADSNAVTFHLEKLSQIIRSKLQQQLNISLKSD